jgi:hypothetical protein
MLDTVSFGIPMSEMELEGNGHGEVRNAAQARLTSTTAASAERRGQMRKALVVLLGGTGQTIGVHLKARLIAQFGKVPAWVRLLAFDTANEPAVVRLPDGRHVSLEPGTEFIHIGNVPTGRIAKYRERQRAINERFGDSLTRLPPTVLLNGARQVRLLGLLAVYWHYAVVEEHLKRAIWYLAGRDNQQDDVVDTNRGLNVFLAHSDCGGTGAGAFLDVAYTIRDLVGELGDLGEFCQMTDVGVLPGAFRGIDGPNILPNTVASLMELNHAMLHSDFHAVYPTGRVIDASTPPFDLCYLIDGVDEHGGVWRSVHDVCRMTAEAIYLQMASQLGRKGENDFDNLKEVITGVTDEGHGTFFGSIGLSAYHFDADEAYAYCARRQIHTLIREGWGLKPDADAVTKAALTIAQGGQLSADALMEDLRVDKDGVRLAIDLSVPGHIRRLGAGQQAHEAVNFVEDYRTLRLQGTFPTAIEANSRELRHSQARMLRERIATMAGAPGLGAPFGRAVLGRLQTSLMAIQAELETRQEALLSAEETGQVELNRRREALLVSGLAGFVLRGSRVGTAQCHYLDAAAGLYDTVLERLLCTAALRNVERLSAVALALAEDLSRLEARLSDVVRLLGLAEETPVARRTLSDTELFSPEYGDSLYERFAPSLAETAQTVCAASDILRWSEKPAHELAIDLCRGAGHAFERVRGIDVETALRELSDGISVDARRQALMERAVPSWIVEHARLPNGGNDLKRVDVIGVPQEADSSFADQNGNLVSTQDTSRIVAMRVTMGAPYTALQQFPVWQRRYEEVRGQRMLHVLPTFHSSVEQALRAFAVGLVFKLIYAQGSWYYYRRPDRLEQPLRLAQGLENALNAFTAREGLAKEVMERIEKQVSVQLTTAEAVAKLDAYWEAGNRQGDLDDMDLRLRRAAREYADELREMIRVSEGILE